MGIIVHEKRVAGTHCIPLPDDPSDGDALVYNDTTKQWEPASTVPPAEHTHPGTDITSAVANATDADTVDGMHASDLAEAEHTHPLLDLDVSGEEPSHLLWTLVDKGETNVYVGALTTQTPTENAVPIAGEGGHLDSGWIDGFSEIIEPEGMGYTVGFGLDFGTLEEALDYFRHKRWDGNVILKMSDSYEDEANFAGVTGGALYIQGTTSTFMIVDIKTLMTGTLTKDGDNAVVVVTSSARIPGAGGYVQVFGCTSPENNGKFEVISKVGTTITYYNPNAVEESVASSWMLGYPVTQLEWCEVPTGVNVSFVNLHFPSGVDVRGGTATFTMTVAESEPLVVSASGRIDSLRYAYFCNDCGWDLYGPCVVDAFSPGLVAIVNNSTYGVTIHDSACVCDVDPISFVDCAEEVLDESFCAMSEDSEMLEGHSAADFAEAKHTHEIADITDFPSMDYIPVPEDSPAEGDVLQYDGSDWIPSSAMTAPDAPVVTSAAGSGGIVTVTASQSPVEYVDGWELVHDPSEATDPDTLSPVFSRTGCFEFPAKESLYIWVRAALGTARSAWTALPLYSTEYEEDPINGVNGSDVPGMSALGIAKKLVYSTASPAPPGEAVYLQSADHMAKTFSMWTVASGIAATEFGCRITTKLHWMNDTGRTGRLAGFVCGADSTIFSSFSTATFYAVWLHQVGTSTVYVYFSKFVGNTDTNIWTSSNIWTTASIQSNGWNDVVFTRNGANFTLSVNGVEVMNRTNSDIPASSSRIHVGLVHATNITQIVFGDSILVESRNSTTLAIAPGKVADADLLDGNEASAFAPASHTHAGTDVTSAVANATDADTVDGQHASSFAADGHDHDSEYADAEHDHDSKYAAVDHDHDSEYAATGHSHANTVYDPETVLLVNFDDVCGATTYKRTRDISQFRRPVVITGGSLDSNNKKYGTYSVSLDGSDDYAYVPLDDVLFHALDGDYTVEAWIRFSADPTECDYGIFGLNLTAGGLWGLRLVGDAEGFWNFKWSKGVLNIESDDNYTLAAETWYHVAIVQKAGTVRMFLDGQQIGTGTLSTANAANSFTKSAATPTDGITLGVTRLPPEGNKFFPGNIDEFRISTTARYWANFTPPASALSPYL